MKTYIHLQLFKPFPKVNFFTFKFEDSELSETDKFFTKFEDNDFVFERKQILNLKSIELTY